MKPTYEELEAKYAALAAENVGLKSASEIIRHLNANREEANFCGIDDCHIDDAVAAMITPDTDRFVAEMKAQGVEEFASLKEAEHAAATNNNRRAQAICTARKARDFAKQLREVAQ